MATEWHAGEEEMHKRLRVPQGENPTSPFLSPFATNLLTRSPLLALGTLDSSGRPWTTLWGGEPGFAWPVAQSVIAVKATIDLEYDPVSEVLLGKDANGQVKREESPGRMIGGLAIDLESRKRVKLYGRMAAGALKETAGNAVAEASLLVKIEQSLGNCPKYLNKKHIIPRLPKPTLASTKIPLPKEATDLITRSDLFFISSSNHDSDMDTNHRGGPQGFVRILSNDANGLTIVYPEYSGNRLYQTLGNLTTTPQAGLVFPDFNTGDVVYLTGRTEILAGEKATNLISHTNLAVKIYVESVRYVTDGLSFRGEEGERSPYNPPVRFLASEAAAGVKDTGRKMHAKLIEKKILSPNVGRFRFKISDADKTNRWKPGQYVALDFKNELDIGYSHMRDDDPKSLNDDYIRTFTVSSSKNPTDTYDQFDITIRKVGIVTNFLFRHNIRSELEVPLNGFGGEFFIDQGAEGEVSFVAGGVGITPLLAQVPELDFLRFQIYWAVRLADLGLVLDTFDKYRNLASHTKLFITGEIGGCDGMNKSICLKKLRESGATLQERRIEKSDISEDSANRWFPHPDNKVSNPKTPEWKTSLASAILPTAGVPISRILNHPNIIALVDIIHTDSLAGSTKNAGITANIAVYEDMNQGSLDLILPSPENYPKFTDLAAWRALSLRQTRIAFPSPKTDSKDDWQKHDDDWQPILIREVSPKQIWFKRTSGGATYGECKLGGFGKAVVTGFPGGKVAKSQKKEGMEWWFQSPEQLAGTEGWCPASEIWSLGATVYTMMTGIPPPQQFDFKEVVSRMSDKNYTSPLREIVTDMLSFRSSARPTTAQLVGRIEQGWEDWRETKDANGYVDWRDRSRGREVNLEGEVKEKGLPGWGIIESGR
ncbi:hypothetical protein DID88_004522 [Monilinia fructigena]|uniref:FAD-binding FR-type domain-containing protein n=1 Tax=Monilinia fructigena TaxID=38457 RepID=A0A395IWF9_9HELO|nr:hypothetical protein DID88_004522 [Monilinia fructigena]